MHDALTVATNTIAPIHKSPLAIATHSLEGFWVAICLSLIQSIRMQIFCKFLNNFSAQIKADCKRN